MQNLVKISENEERLIALENSIGVIIKALEKYHDVISRMQIFIYLQSCDDPGMMEIFLKLFAKEAIDEKLSTCCQLKGNNETSKN